MQGYNVARQSSDAALRARTIMENKIEEGRVSATRLLEHVHTSIPNDFVARGCAFSFDSDEGGLRFSLTRNRPGDGQSLLAERCTVHRHALSQIASKAGIPGAYLSGLVHAPEEWKRDLATRTLNDFFTLDTLERDEDLSSSRHLVRVVNNDVRAVLSDRYRRLDSRPLVEAFAQECQVLNAVPVEGTVTDVRVALKAFLPMVFEPVPGEVMCIGIEWSNSDFGAGKHAVRAFIFRLTCLNGATMEDVLAQVHLGSRVTEDVEYSDRTYRLDTAAQVSALHDVVRNTLGPKNVNNLLDVIKAANEKEVEWKNVTSKLGKRLLKEELRAVRDAFESEDVINLPPQKSLWRVSNAVSWIAGKTEDEDRRLDLQRLAGEVMHGKPEVSEAA